MTTTHPIAAHLEKTGQKPRALAKRLGVSPVTVSRWINGHRRPEPEMAEKIETETGIDARVLLGIPKRKKPAGENARC
jgi:transcriptional regulator with XRE-family HTH domain